mmetsp:Transcript_678/g.1632  ORF Transcript_678/g.1632 Transcript_678/m.1632 type:complete len:83 (-) Transcript_678:2490-2738(-)
MTGNQALSILRSEEMKTFKEKHGDDIPILVDGRVGIIQSNDDQGEENFKAYIEQLKLAGATGAVIGGGLLSGEFDLSFTDFV